MEPLAKSLNRISLSAAENSEKSAEHERRLDSAFAAFTKRMMKDRQGWSPRWTASLRAELWSRFALECREMLRDSGIPPQARGFDLEQISGELPEGYRRLAGELMTLIETPKILAIVGMRGTGKTTLSYGAVVKFCDLGRSALYCTIAEFFHELTGVKWDEKQKVRDRFFRQELLVLDEVQVRDSDREWQDNELTTLIDRRYREQKATILISNLAVEDLKKNLGDSIWRRLIETGGEPIVTESWGRIEEVKQQILENKRNACAGKRT